MKTRIVINPTNNIKKGETLVEVNNLEVKFTVREKTLTAIRNISLDIYKGETLAIVGESGSGKSVFTKCLTGMIEENGTISDGYINYGGVDLTKIKNNEDWIAIRGKKIATIFQDPMTSLNPLRRIGSQITEVIINNNNVLENRYNSFIAGPLNNIANEKTNYKNEVKAINSKKKKDIVDFNDATKENIGESKYSSRQEIDEVYNKQLKELAEAHEKKLAEYQETYKKSVEAAKKDRAEYIAEHEKIRDEKLQVLNGELNAAKKACKEELKAIDAKYKADVKELFSHLEERALDENVTESIDSKKKEIAALQSKYDADVKQLNEESKSALLELEENASKKKNEIVEAEKNENKDEILLSRLKRELDVINEQIYKNKRSLVKKSKALKVEYKQNKTKLNEELHLIGIDGVYADKAKLKAQKKLDEKAAKQKVKDVEFKIFEVKDEFACSLKMTKFEAKKRAINLLKRVGIKDAENRYDDFPYQYSGGMRQRVVIAIALACTPDVLICDEPTTALDVTIQAQILDLITELKEEYGFTVLFITHDLGVVAEVADRVAVMYAGQIIEYGSVNDIYYDPRHPYTWSLLSSLPQLGEKGETLYSITGTPPSLFTKINGDAFAPRSPYALEIDFVKEPPMFKVSETHYAKTWLLDPRAPKIQRPAIIEEISERVAKIYAGKD